MRRETLLRFIVVVFAGFIALKGFAKVLDNFEGWMDEQTQERVRMIAEATGGE